MSIESKRNKYIITLQIILTFVLIIALTVCSLGDLVLLPTEATETMESYTDIFYSEMRDADGTELGASVELGFLTLWQDGLSVLMPLGDLIAGGDTLTMLSSEAISESKSLVYMCFLVKEALDAGFFEGLAFLVLTLGIMLLPAFLFLCLIICLSAVIKHRHDLRTAYLRVTHTLSWALRATMLPMFITVFAPYAIFAPHMTYLMWAVGGTLLLSLLLTHLKKHTSGERGFLFLSHALTVAVLAACIAMLWLVKKVGLIELLYGQLATMGGYHVFSDAVNGYGDISAILAFLISAIFLLCLASAFLCLFHSLTRLCCLFNANEKRKNDHLFAYCSALPCGFLVLLLLLNASGSFAMELSDEVYLYYFFAFGAAIAVLLFELLHGVLCYFLSRIDTVTRLEVLSGYAACRAVMDAEAVSETETKTDTESADYLDHTYI